MARHTPKDKKRKKRVMKEFELGEISLVDHPAQTTARVAILKRSPYTQPTDMEKRLALTTPVAGHAHMIVGVEAGSQGLGEKRAGQTSFVEGHAHDWLMDDAGNIILADAEGHSHGISVLVQKAEDGDGMLEDLQKRQFSAEQRKELAESGAALPDGSFPIQSKADLKNAIGAFGRAKDKAEVAKHIRRRAKALGATELLPEEGKLADLLSKGLDGELSEAADGGNPENEMTPEEKAAFEKAAQDKLDAEKVRADRAEAVVGLSPDQREHFDGLKGDDQDEFLAKSTEDRDAILKNLRDADPVIYTATDGREFRKTADSNLVAEVKRNDQLQKQLADGDAIRKREGYEKRAGDELGHLKGEVPAKADLLEAVDSLPEERRAPVMEILKSKDAGMAMAMERLGHKGDGDEKTGDEAIKAIAKNLRDKNPSLTPEQAYDDALKTPEGQALFTKMREGS